MFKKRKLISIMLTISMMLTLFPFAAFAEEGNAVTVTKSDTTTAEYADLASAVSAADDGSIITLNKPVTTDQQVTMDKNITLDLGGFTLESSADQAIVVGQNKTLSMKNGTLKSTGATFAVGLSKDAKFNMAKDTVIDATGAGVKGSFTDTDGNTTIVVNGKINSQDVGVFCKGPKNKVVVDGATINSKYFGVYQNGSYGGSSFTLKNSTIVDTLADGAGVYVSNNKTNSNDQNQGFQTLTIENCNITGATGVEVKYTNVTIDDKSTLTATGKAVSTTPNNNGSTTSGFALAITHNGKDTSKDSAAGKVEIKGGTFNGYVGVQKPSADQTTAAQVTISGGTFTNDVSEFIPEGSFQDENGVVNALNETTAAAKIGNVLYGTLDKAIEAANSAENGATVEVLRDASIKDAEFVINKNVVLKSAKAAKINVTPKADLKAFTMMPNGKLTLDGVQMTIKGTKNTEGKAIGWGIDVRNTNETQTKVGGNLTLKNGAVLNLKELNRATIASGAVDKDVNGNHGTINLEKGTAMNISDIRGNASNGAIWTVDGATLDVKNCGDHGLSAQAVNAKNGATVSVDNAGLTGIRARTFDVQSSDVSVTNSGSKLKDNANYNHAVEIVNDGKLVIKDSNVTLKDNKTENQTIFVNDAKTEIQGSKIDAELVYAETDATKNQIHVEYIVDGKVYFAITDEVGSNGKVEFTEPADPTLSGYTFRYWDYPSNVTVSGDKVYLTPVKDQNTYTFVAKFSKNSSTPSVTEYSVTVKKTDNGSASVSPKRAEAGDKVTINVDPDKGYVVDAVVVTDKDGDKITVTKKSDTKYTFTMPKSRVDVKVTFKAEQPSDIPFVDVVKDAWYYPAVEYVYNNDLMNGTNGGLTFEPNVNLNRAMMAAVLYNMEGGPACDKSGLFSDVADGMWYTDAVNWAASNNIVSGMPDGTYAPNQVLTREQMASILYRYAEYKGIKTDARADLGKFTDGTTTSAWATDVVQWAVAEKLINGVGTELQPKGTASRAQVATVLMNYCENVAK